ncbi:uncharacterized protein LOC128206565 isoform X2 [Mya arenaria]|uniref:uncharacterized protein LOC128206565 isoform X2 n=1 Tax=Mya arenaria TaxID=6604 RepID=UPI0022DEADBE|nr:uncharacterized protein LOC128206565 isoform X2 [Mya arenaria]
MRLLLICLLCTLALLVEGQELNCTEPCSCCNLNGASGCSIHPAIGTDFCFDGCVDTIYGHRCKNKCDGNCLKCEQEHGSPCNACKDTYFNTSSHCSQACSVGCVDQLCEDDGECNCTSVFEGATCTTCIQGKYGENCTLNCTYENCRCTFDDGCDSCKVGYYNTSTQCTTSCSNGCVDGECFENGNCSCLPNFNGTTCILCDAGLFGDYCNNTCPSNCTSCDRFTGVCDECPSTTVYGDFCNISCSQSCIDLECLQKSGNCTVGCLMNFYDQQCDKKCSVNCKEGDTNLTQCDRSGNCTNGCNEGFRGDNCDDPCNVSCVSCDQTTGICDKCNIGTVFGEYCQNECNKTCFDLECNKVSGKCSNGCNDQYFGEFCEIECPVNCLQIGNESRCFQNGTCRNGCIDAFWGDQCDYPCRTQSCLCTSNERCVDCRDGFYDTNTYCEKPCSNGCVNGNCIENGSCLCLPNFVGSKCTYCLEGLFGEHCNETCPGNCSYCNRTTGVCQECSTNTVYGENCNVPCSQTCIDSQCMQITGNCAKGCLPNYHDLKCDKECSEKCKDGDLNSSRCDRTGRCLNGCKEGYWGNTCETACYVNCISCEQDTGSCKQCNSNTMHGEYCNKTCSPNCIDNKCYKDSGYCINDCIDGYFGDLCIRRCPSTCKPQNYQKLCDNNGVCLNGCVDGYYKDLCDETCISNCLYCDQNSGSCNACKAVFYGQFCNITCSTSCIDQECSVNDGNCTKGCITNYYGPQCKEECSVNCKDNYEESRCDKSGQCLLGCIAGFKGMFCTDELIATGGLSATSIAVIIAVVLLCVIGIVVMCCIYRRRLFRTKPTYEVHKNMTDNISLDSVEVEKRTASTKGVSSKKSKTNRKSTDGIANPVYRDISDEETSDTTDIHVSERKHQQEDGSLTNVFSTVCEDFKPERACLTFGKHLEEGQEMENSSITTSAECLGTEMTSKISNSTIDRGFENKPSSPTSSSFAEGVSVENVSTTSDATVPWSSIDVASFGEYVDKKISTATNGTSLQRGLDLNVLSSTDISTFAEDGERLTTISGEQLNLSEKNGLSPTSVSTFAEGFDKKRLVTSSDTTYTNLETEISSPDSVGTFSEGFHEPSLLTSSGSTSERVEMEHSPLTDVTTLAKGSTIESLQMADVLMQDGNMKTEMSQMSSNSILNGNLEMQISPTTGQLSSDKQLQIDSPAPINVETASEVVIKNKETEEIDSLAMVNTTEIVATDDQVEVRKLGDYIDKKTEADYKEEFRKTATFQNDTLCTSDTQVDNGKQQKTDNGAVVSVDDAFSVPVTILEKYIDGHNRKKEYIASEDPVDTNNVEDISAFWKMVWEEKVEKVVNLSEAVIGKHEGEYVHYWPDPDSFKKFGKFQVTSTSEEEYADYTKRVFKITKGSKERTVHQFHYTSWPEKGVPDDVTSVVDFREKVLNAPSKLNGPTIVQCRKGLGPIGTYIALDILTKKGESEGTLDIPGCVKNLRQKRQNLIQTPEQYRYLHKTLAHSLAARSITVSGDKFPKYVKDARKSELKQQFEQLQQSFKPDSEEVQKKEGEENKRRLHFSVIPDASDYVNAKFIDGLRVKRRYLMSQTPLPETVGEFLTLVIEENISCIVSFEVEKELKKTDGIYFPGCDMDALKKGDFEVTCTNEQDTNGSFMTRSLTVKSGVLQQNTDGKPIPHYQFLKWDMQKNVPTSAAEFLSFMKFVEETANKQNRGPILIHCFDGASQSGLFVAVSLAIQQMSEEHEVSIVSAVKKVKAARTMSIPNQAQFDFCHDCVLEYLKASKADRDTRKK